jgi:WD40 repeat protein
MRLARLTESDANCVLRLHYRADGKVLTGVVGRPRQPIEIVSWHLAPDHFRSDGYAIEGGARMASWPVPAFAEHLAPFATFGYEYPRSYLTLCPGRRSAPVRLDLGGPQYHVGAVAFEPGARHLVAVVYELEDRFGASGSEPPTVAVARWNVVDLKANPKSAMRRFDAYDPRAVDVLQTSAVRRPTAAAFSADGRFLAVGFEGMAEVWRWPALQHVGTLFNARGATGEHALTFDPKGERLVSVSASGVAVADLARMRLAPRYHVPPDPGTEIRGAAFSPDGTRLALACGTGGVRFLDAPTGNELQRFHWSIGAVWSVAFAPDGLTCAAGGENGQVVIWDVDA